MDKEKLSKLQEGVRIGGKGTPRRKKKIVHKTGVTDEKKLQSVLKKIGANPISGIEEANFFRDDQKVMHFKAPKVQASIAYNTFAVTGKYEVKTLTEMLPDILPQLMRQRNEPMAELQKLARSLNPEAAKAMASKVGAAADAGDDDVPELVGNFEDASKTAAAAPAAEGAPAPASA